MSDITVQLGGGITVQFPVSTPGVGGEAYLDSLEVCDSDNTSSGTGNSAEEAGVEIGKYYITAFNHVEVSGGLLKMRLS